MSLFWYVCVIVCFYLYILFGDCMFVSVFAFVSEILNVCLEVNYNINVCVFWWKSMCVYVCFFFVCVAVFSIVFFLYLCDSV